MKLYKSKTDKELFYYFNAAKEQLWMYRHRYTDSNDKRREKSKQRFKSENEAYRSLLKVRTDILNGDIKKVEYENVTVTEWLDIWYETKANSWKVSTCIQRKRFINNNIKPLIGKYKLAKLDTMTYERKLINGLLKTLAPSTVKAIHNIFKIAINAAVRNETIKKNNFLNITIPDNREQKENFLSSVDLQKLIRHARERANITSYTMLFLLAHTGMRKGEAQGLKWKDIDFENQLIKIERTRDGDGVRSPKTKNSYRDILIDDELINQLKTYKRWCNMYKLYLGNPLTDEDYVFVSVKSGKPYSHVAFNNALVRLVKRAGVRYISPHGLRHTHATILLNKGVSVATVAKRLGNTAQEINRTYGHSDFEADQKAVSIFTKSVNYG